MKRSSTGAKATLPLLRATVPPPKKDFYVHDFVYFPWLKYAENFPSLCKKYRTTDGAD